MKVFYLLRSFLHKWALLLLLLSLRQCLRIDLLILLFDCLTYGPLLVKRHPFRNRISHKGFLWLRRVKKRARVFVQLMLLLSIGGQLAGLVVIAAAYLLALLEKKMLDKLAPLGNQLNTSTRHKVREDLLTARCWLVVDGDNDGRLQVWRLLTINGRRSVFLQ